MFKITLLPDPTVAILNNKPQTLTHCQFKLLLLVTTAAKLTIAKVWKSTILCIVSDKHRVTQAMIHTKTETILLAKLSKFEALWLPWIEHYLPPGLDCSLL